MVHQEREIKITLKTLSNSLEVLKYFTKEKSSWGVRELANVMGMNHSIIYRILVTFEEYGFLRKNEFTNKYELGVKLFEYGLIVKESMKINEMIYPIMKEVSDELGESTFLTWLDGTEGVCVEISECSKNVRYEITLGSRAPLYAGASNKVIMAFLPQEIQQKILEKKLAPITSKTVTDEESIKRSLEEIRRNGWAYSIGEYTEDVVGIAVPLFHGNTSIIASLTVAGPSYRIPKEKVGDMLQTLQNGQQKIQDTIDRYNL